MPITARWSVEPGHEGARLSPSGRPEPARTTASRRAAGTDLRERGSIQGSRSSAVSASISSSPKLGRHSRQPVASGRAGREWRTSFISGGASGALKLELRRNARLDRPGHHQRFLPARCSGSAPVACRLGGHVPGIRRRDLHAEAPQLLVVQRPRGNNHRGLPRDGCGRCTVASKCDRMSTTDYKSISGEPVEAALDACRAIARHIRDLHGPVDLDGGHGPARRRRRGESRAPKAGVLRVGSGWRHHDHRMRTAPRPSFAQRSALPPASKERSLGRLAIIFWIAVSHGHVGRCSTGG